MDRADKISEDVIKIFHNAKGSIFNNILEWTENLKDENNPYTETSVPTNQKIMPSNEHRK